MEYSVTVTSSIEYPKNMSFVIFLAKCPLRCPYCSNSEILEEGTEISLEEIYEKIDDSAMFMDAVVVSGGEPLVQYEDVIEIFKYVREIGLKTKLDTSGVYPDRLQKILDLGLVDYVAMDIKNCKEKYSETAGIVNIELSDIENWRIRPAMSDNGLSWNNKHFVINESNLIIYKLYINFTQLITLKFTQKKRID